MKRRHALTIQANAPDAGPAEVTFAAPVVLEAAAAGAATPRRFHMDAYSGGPMQIAFWRYPVVVDLSGLTVRNGAKVYLDHDRSQRVGHIDATEIREGKSLRVSGLVSSTSQAAKEVVADADRGYPWQASIGASVVEVEFVGEGTTVKVNGRDVAGPVNVARKTALSEVSFVGNGADDQTAARIAARAAAARPKEQHMDFEAWLKAHGWDAGTLSDAQKADLTAAWKAEVAAAKPDAKPDAKPEAKPDAKPDVKADAAPGRIDAEIAEIQRREAIEQMAVKFVRQNPDRAEAIKATMAEAAEKGWTLNQTELALLRQSRALPPGVRETAAPPQAREIEAALALAGGLPDPEKHYPAETLDRASQRFPHGLSLGEALTMAARAGGWHGHSLRGDLREILRATMGPREVQAGFSTVDIGGILSAVSNKFLLAGFMSVERTWRNICAVRNVPDFKTTTSYRLIGKDQYEKVAPGGELKHGTLGEETFTNKADTYGLMLVVDRRDIINDDLGAITTTPRKLGRGSGLKINDVFWTVFMANSTFFTAARANYVEGAGTALSIDGLTQVEAAFLDMVDSDGKPTGIMPQILLVPTALSAVGTQLFKSVELRDTTASLKYPVANPHQGKFRTEVSRYLANSHYTGHSAKAWYLLANPEDLPVVEVAFLDGQEAPTIETAEADFNVLGIQMRGYHDFGVALVDPKGGVKSKGEA